MINSRLLLIYFDLFSNISHDKNGRIQTLVPGVGSNRSVYCATIIANSRELFKLLLFTRSLSFAQLYQNGAAINGSFAKLCS